MRGFKHVILEKILVCQICGRFCLPVLSPILSRTFKESLDNSVANPYASCFNLIWAIIKGFVLHYFNIYFSAETCFFSFLYYMVALYGWKMFLC